MQTFFYRDNSGKEIGPLNLSTLSQLRLAGVLNDDTPVRSEGSDWKSLGELLAISSAPQPPQKTSSDSNPTQAIYSFVYKNLQAVFFLGFALSVVLWFVPAGEINGVAFSLFDLTRLIFQRSFNQGFGVVLFLSFCASIAFAVLTIQLPRRWVFIAGACYTSVWLLYNWFLSGPSNESVKVFFLYNLFDYVSSAMTLTGFWIRQDISPTCKSYLKKCPHCNASLSFFRVAKMTELKPTYSCPHCGGTATIPKSHMQRIQIISIVLGFSAAYLFNLHNKKGFPGIVVPGFSLAVILWTLGYMLFGRFEAQVQNGKPFAEHIPPVNTNMAPRSSIPSTIGGSSTTARLTELLALKEKRLISAEDYEKKKSEVIRDL